MKQEQRKGCNEIDKLSQCYLTVRIVSWFVLMVENCNHMPALTGSYWNTNTHPSLRVKDHKKSAQLCYERAHVLWQHKA